MHYYYTPSNKHSFGLGLNLEDDVLNYAISDHHVENCSTYNYYECIEIDPQAITKQPKKEFFEKLCSALEQDPYEPFSSEYSSCTPAETNSVSITGEFNNLVLTPPGKQPVAPAFAEQSLSFLSQSQAEEADLKTEKPSNELFAVRRRPVTVIELSPQDQAKYTSLKSKNSSSKCNKDLLRYVIPHIIRHYEKKDVEAKLSEYEKKLLNQFKALKRKPSFKNFTDLYGVIQRDKYTVEVSELVDNLRIQGFKYLSSVSGFIKTLQGQMSFANKLSLVKKQGVIESIPIKPHSCKGFLEQN